MAARSQSGNASALSALPSIDDLLRSETGSKLLDMAGRRRLTELARRVVDELRYELKNGKATSSKSRSDMLSEAESRLTSVWQDSRSTGLRGVINATGVVIHTNLGRAPLSEAAKAALVWASGYCSVEYDIATGERGRRGARVEAMICELTGAEDALIVNNCAAAAYLVLSMFAVNSEVIISRGELVEIGGEFRVPDVLSRSGATLKEVGTTNRTKLADYEKAVTDRTSMILKVHPSNYRIVGFTTSPSLTELSELAKRKNILVYEDAGSGAVADLGSLGLADEPVIGESIRAGADIVTFSGDKLLGGPQAGIIAGKSEYIERLRKDPLYRALRVSKLVYAALEATLEPHLRGNAMDEVPVLKMLAATADQLESRCSSLIQSLDGPDLSAEIIRGNSAVGGGAAPMVQPESALIVLKHSSLSAYELERKLRTSKTPVIARIVDDRVTIDLRTVSESEMKDLAEALKEV
jgi:L-seryl-tRNA(Ser) seleniumtransferase